MIPHGAAVAQSEGKGGCGGGGGGGGGGATTDRTKLFWLQTKLRLWFYI